jgi:hypothetical protein
MKFVTPLLLLLLCCFCCLRLGGQTFTFQDQAFLAQQKSAAGGGSFSAAFVQYVYAYPGTSIKITNTAGNCLVAEWAASAGTNIVFSDSKSNVWTILTNTFAPTWTKIYVAAAFNIAAGSNTVTVTATGPTDAGLYVGEYSGLTAANAVAAGISSSSSATAVTNSLTTTSTSILLGFWANEENGGSPTATNNTSVVAAALRHYGSSHWDAQFDWLNSGSGWAASTNSLAVYQVTSLYHAWICIALR